MQQTKINHLGLPFDVMTQENCRPATSETCVDVRHPLHAGGLNTGTGTAEHCMNKIIKFLTVQFKMTTNIPS